MEWACSTQLSAHNTILGGLVPQQKVFRSRELAAAYPWMEDIEKHIYAGRRRETIRNPMGRIVDSYSVDTAIAEGLREALVGKQTPEEALQLVSEALEKRLAD